MTLATLAPAPGFDSTRFMTIDEFAGEMSVTAEDIWLSVVNRGYLHAKPWMLVGDAPTPVTGNLAWNHANSPSDIFFLRDDLPKHLDRIANEAVAEAERVAISAELAKYTTRLAYAGAIDREDRETRDDSHPVFAETGEPAFEKFRGPWHVEDWVRWGSPTVLIQVPSWRVDRDAQAARRVQYEDFKRRQVDA